MNQNVSDYHFEYMDVTQHWHKMGGYAGGDHLLTAIHKGWQIEGPVKEEQHWCSGMRAVTIYHFPLTRNGEKMVMPVINNPYVDRFIYSRGLEVVRKNAETSV